MPSETEINSILNNSIGYITITNEKDSTCNTTSSSYTLKYYNYKTCHGCEGKGWVKCEGIAQKCPVCEGKGKIFSEETERIDKYPVYPTYPWYVPIDDTHPLITLCSTNSCSDNCSNCTIPCSFN